MTEDERKPFPSPWTDTAERPTPYDHHTASVEARHMGLASRRFPRAARALFVLAIVFIVLVVVVVAMEAPWAESSPANPEPVSEADVREAFAGMVELAAERTPEAMERLCALSRLNACHGLSGQVVAFPESAPGDNVAIPAVLCSRDVGDGAWILVVEGTDGYDRPYVSQVVFDRDSDGNVVPLHEAAFWLGIAYNGSKVTGSTVLTTAYSAQEGVDAAEHTEQALTRARAFCEMN